MGDLSGTLETLVPTLGRRLLEKGIRLQHLTGPRARWSFLRPGQSGVGTKPCQRNPQGWLGNMGTLGMNHPILGVSNFDPFPHDTHMIQHIQPDDSFWKIFPCGQSKNTKIEISRCFFPSNYPLSDRRWTSIQSNDQEPPRRCQVLPLDTQDAVGFLVYAGAAGVLQLFLANPRS